MAERRRAARGPDVRILELRPGDAGKVMRAAALFDHPPVRSAAIRYLAERSNRFLLAVSAGRAVGFLRGTGLLQIETRRPQFFLYEIAVAPGWRRRGVGRALVEALMGSLRRGGFEEAFVFTSPRNRAAVGLYRSTGAVTETAEDRMFVYRLVPRAHALVRRPAPRPPRRT